MVTNSRWTEGGEPLSLPIESGESGSIAEARDGKNRESGGNLGGILCEEGGSSIGECTLEGGVGVADPLDKKKAELAVWAGSGSECFMLGGGDGVSRSNGLLKNALVFFPTSRAIGDGSGVTTLTSVLTEIWGGKGDDARDSGGDSNAPGTGVGRREQASKPGSTPTCSNSADIRAR